MLILDNLIFRWQRSGGISAVWYELSKRIIRDFNAYRFIEYKGSADMNNYRRQLTIPQDRLTTVDDCLFGIKRYMPIFVDENEPFIFHSSYYRTCRNKNAVNIITLHDFTYEYFRSGIYKYLHCKTKYKALGEADYIVCISKNTKNDLLKFCPDIGEKKIRIIYNGVSDSYYCKHLPNEDFLLFVGARDNYKNFRVSALAAAESNKELVICGKELNEEEKKWLDSIPKCKYTYQGFVTNEELNQLYNKAYALLYPSSYEGFGIPVIEAQMAGCPVIAMNRSSIPEVIGDRRLLIEKISTNEILKKIKMLQSDSLRMEIVNNGINHSKKFSWEKTYQKYIDLYRETGLL